MCSGAQAVPGTLPVSHTHAPGRPQTCDLKYGDSIQAACCANWTAWEAWAALPGPALPGSVALASFGFGEAPSIVTAEAWGVGWALPRCRMSPDTTARGMGHEKREWYERWDVFGALRGSRGYGRHCVVGVGCGSWNLGNAQTMPTFFLAAVDNRCTGLPVAVEGSPAAETYS